MNYKVVLSILGKTLVLEALLLIFPMFVGIIYQENNFLAFLIPILALLVVGIPLTFLKSKDNSLYAKEGFVIVSLTWILMSLFGALPFVISGEIPNYIDAVFETVSGFTTTGASILTGSQIESMSKGLMFWRMFTHWIGGMGVLVFVLAIMPANNAGVMHVFRSEAPGPTANKLASKLKFTARILYGIYIALTLLEIIFLLFGGFNLFESLTMSFSTAGTGGFSFKGDSAASFSSYIQVVISVFMFLFSLNFNVYYLLLIGNFSKAFSMEEVKTFFIIVVVATISVALNLFFTTANGFSNFGEALKHAFFQVTAISSTTGLTSTDFTLWPTLSIGILLFLTVMGACGGSTGGGLKVSRLMLLLKSSSSDFKKLIHPHAVITTTFDGEPVDTQTERNVRTYFIVWVTIVAVSTLLLSIFNNTDVFTNFLSTLSSIGNVGPWIQTNSYVSKILLSLVMLIGRLEIFPMLFLFIPSTWKKG